MKVRSLRPAWLAAAVLVAASCASSKQEVVPTSHLVGGGGPPIAAYTLLLNGVRVGDVNVRSGGTFRAEIEGRKESLLDVSVSIDNDSATPIRVPLAQIQVNGIGTRTLSPVSVNGQSALGQLAVAPQSSQTLDVVYQLPPGTKPTDVDRFQLDWVVWVDGTPIRHGTSFAAVRPVPVVPAYQVGFYAPFVVGPVTPFSPFCGPFYCYGYF